jgi:hypothetical protein
VIAEPPSDGGTVNVTTSCVDDAVMVGAAGADGTVSGAPPGDDRRM